MSARTIEALLVHDLGQAKSRNVQFVAFRDNLWIGSYRQIETASENIIETILEAHPKREQIENYVSSFDDVCNFVRDYVPDALCGDYDRKTRQVRIHHGYSPTTSPLVRKITEALRAQSVEQTSSVNEDDTRVYKKKKLRGDWDFSQPFYHGTSSEYFEGIVRFGLKPMPEQTNFRDVVHEDKIFLTPNWTEAESHAYITSKGTYSVYSGRHKKNFVPMIVSITVPDPARMIPDYDVDREADDAWYNQSADPQRFYSISSEKASKHAGRFGYQGRIPSNFIQALYFYSFYDKDWKRLTPDKFAKAVYGVNNYGEDYWYSRLGYPEEEM